MAEFGRVIRNGCSISEHIEVYRFLVHRSSMTGFLLKRGLTNRSSIDGYPKSQSMASLGHVQWRLSGGAGNTNPLLSLGGAMSNTHVDSQSIRPMGDMPGITVVRGSSNERGIGTIRITSDEQGRRWADWTPSGGLEGGAVQIMSDGRYTLLSGGGTDHGYLSVDIEMSAIDSSDVVYELFVDNGYEEILPAVDGLESEQGITDYRCMYLYNSSDKGAFREMLFYLKQDTYSPTDIFIGFQPEGVNYEPPIVADRHTAPAGVVFTQPALGDPLTPPDVVWGRRLAVWVKRVVPAGVYVDTAHDLSIISYGVKF